MLSIKKLLLPFISSFKQLFEHKGEKVIAFVGKSGTGKSYKAKPLAKKMRADLIIDDGLLIEGDKIIAGHSAKKEETFLAAVRVSLFDDKKHREEVANKLKEKEGKKVLIIGTSEKMINKIVSRLQLPPPYKIVKIEDVSTQKEIEDALRQRNMEGKHVIPLPSYEVKKNYPHIFYDKVRLFFQSSRRRVIVKESAVLFEKSVVRPRFFKREIQRVPLEILSNNIKQYIFEIDAKIVLKDMRISFDSKGYTIALLLDYPSYENIAVSIKNLQKELSEKIEIQDHTSVLDINVVIDKMLPA